MSVPAESIFFDLWSASYDRSALQATTYRPVHDAVLGRLDDVDPSVVLDLGCGTGHLTTRLHERFPTASIVGADLSNGMLERAAERLAEHDDEHAADGDAAHLARHDDGGEHLDGATSFVRSDAQQLPIASGSVDVVVCTESFHWYHDQEAAVAEVHRLLTPGGRFVIASIAAVTGFGDAAIERATAAAGRPVKAIPKRRLRALLESGGFDVRHQGRIPRLGFVPWPVLTDATRTR